VAGCLTVHPGGHNWWLCGYERKWQECVLTLLPSLRLASRVNYWMGQRSPKTKEQQRDLLSYTLLALGSRAHSAGALAR
jgi:hypothetical protein